MALQSPRLGLSKHLTAGGSTCAACNMDQVLQAGCGWVAAIRRSSMRFETWMTRYAWCGCNPCPGVSGVPTLSRQSACRPQSPICTALPPPHNKSNRIGARCSRQRSGCVTGRDAVLCGRCTCMRHCRRPSTSTKRAQSAPPLARATAPLAPSRPHSARPHLGIASRTRRFG